MLYKTIFNYKVLPIKLYLSFAQIIFIIYYFISLFHVFIDLYHKSIIYNSYNL